MVLEVFPLTAPWHRLVALLAFRIWKLGRRVTGASRSTVLLPVLRIILDSGVLYSVTLLAMLMCWVASNGGDYILLDMVRLSVTQLCVVIELIAALCRRCPHSRYHVFSCDHLRIDGAHHLHYVLPGDHPYYSH